MDEVVSFLEALSPLHSCSCLIFRFPFPDTTGPGCALREVRNTGEECVWQGPGRLSNVYSVGGWDEPLSWQRSTSQRNIPALSGMGDWLGNVKGERHPTGFWVQLTDPSERDPLWPFGGQRPHGVKLSLSRCPGDPTSLLLSIKEQFWSYFLNWHCSSVCPAFSFPGKPRAFLTLYIFF